MRLVFRTRATAIELDVLPTRRIYAGFPPRPDGVYDLRVDGRLVHQFSVAGGNVMHVDMATGSVRREAGAPGTLRFDGLTAGDKRVEIWLPH
ncbi:MAG: lipase, partial [Rhodospirillaceae bacterium]|nr:lipase [Rhodospirillaceae bacterium]